MGHLAGIINGYSEFDRHIQTINGTKHFITNNINATLTKDSSHLDPKAHPYDLMNTTLTPGVRKLPSYIDLQILNTVRNNTTPSNITTLTAPLNSDPLIGILNGDFDTQTDWTTRGATTILNSHAVLTEDSPLLSNLTQTFIIPEHAKYLQFTILDTQLGTNQLAPNDVFEVALLDARTLTPLVGTATGLTQTDSLLNLQQTGNAYFSNNVKIAGANTSGDKIALNTPRTVNIDISNIAPGTAATLYFDLLGFGAKDAKIIIDNVILLNDDLITPIANNDTATTDQGQPLLINVLANDSTTNGTVQLGTAANGNIIINPDSTLTYTPNNNFVGTDTFTYIILDNNAISNEATVTVTVNNIAPTINNVTVESTIQEGTTSTFSATATDPGNDLTYSWNFGDGTDAVIGQNVNHIFADNGIYTVTLTVNDTNGANTSQTITANVNNIAPVVQAGADITTDEGTAITFNGNFNDPGILDTHTITWDFGDNSTATGILNPTHTYTKDGIYTATLTVQDNDGGTSSNSLTVTVNNTDPIINSISGDTNVNEGAVANFSATATNPGNDLTYTWNFGDGTDAVIGQNINHIFTEDGSYIVTLTVSDTNGGATSETLSVQVNNAAPIITNISSDTNVNEGAIANFSATATDPGNDTITYTWNFGDGTDAIIGENVNHIFADNGIYTVTLTVSDSEGANTFQTITTNVSNVAPIVEAGVNQTIYISETVNFNGQFTDPGILDTHTITWDFGDGNTTTDILNPSHIYTTDGTYTATLTITDNDHAVSNDIMTVTVKKPPSISVSDVSIIEGDNGEKLAIFTANLSEVSTRNISVNYTTADGTATAGSDYTATNGIITFTAGETTKTIAVEVIADTIDEFDETFFLNLSNATNATIVNTQAIGTIVDNDAPPTIAISDKTITEGDSGTTIATFTVNLSTDSAKPITVQYTTADSTATAGSDYTVTNGTLTFAPGETSKSISIEVTGDTIDEFDETFFLNLSDATNATIVDNQGVGTIVDNDALPVLTINDRTITEGDNGTAAVTFTVSLSTASAKPIAVNYATLDDTAVAGSDYTATNGTLTFAPGETTKTISVQVAGDTVDEFDETFFLNLSNATNATIADDQGVGTIVDNDAPPTLTINDKTVTEGDNGTQTMTFTVSLSNQSQKTISVNYATANGTATAGSDYTATNGTLTFAPGEITKTVSVQIIGDALIESDETFNINLSNATNATIADATGVGTILNNDLPLAFAIKAEGTVTINGGGDFDGNPLDVSDDALIYAGKGFTINGNPVLPVQRDAQGNAILNSAGKLILVDRAVTVAPGYTVTNGPSNQYANLLPPQVVDQQTINIPVYTDVKQLELNRRIPANTPTVTFNVSQNPMNNANDWAAKFPPPGTVTNPTVVQVTGGGLNVPSGITISNYVIIVEQGDINFNGNGHNFNNVVLVSNSGNINLSNLQAQDLSVFASGSINMNGGARFAGSTLMANNSGNIIFNGATTTTDANSNLQVISNGDITYNAAANTRGTFQAVKNFNYNSSSTLFGSIEVKGNITFNSAATVIAVGV
ncbi:PKD domain-containing protein [Anabaena cylindrica UHCC 0172]|uniref:beta strand repeat-containing protein n=1 Tax=Anabaena cylindrica TaxID=1165 RepID=UPI002B1FCB6B|nr:PKD domain-containing protein [Anabaena cylindrica]MEA5551989.1 PKD domain-containing protein [Anabaena cylindrica UHCC 0172]